jgi:hypothetical protein
MRKTINKLGLSFWILLSFIAAAHALPWNSDNAYRILVEYDSATISGTNVPVSLEIHFYRILRDLGEVDRVDRGSVRIVEYTKAAGVPVEYRPGAPGDEKYEMPFRLFREAHTHTPLASDHLSWILRDSDSCLFAIYFDVVSNGPKAGPSDFPMIGGGEPLVASSGILDMIGYGLLTIGDMNNDGVEDIVCGGWNEMGTVHISHNLTDRVNPVFSMWEKLETTDGRLINDLYISDVVTPPDVNGVWRLISQGYSAPRLFDFEPDGDLDIWIQANPWFISKFKYYENVGGPIVPRFEEIPGPVTSPGDTNGAWSGVADWDGDTALELVSFLQRTLRYHQTVAGPPTTLFDAPDLVTRAGAYDWDDDTDKDILFGTTGGNLFYCRNNGNLGGMPQFDSPRPIPGQDITLGSDAFSAPWAADWDGDTDLDLIVGQQSGHFTYFENQGSRFDPDFVHIGCLEADGSVIEFPGDPAEPNGSWWGYSMPIVVDWDGNGVLDFLGCERLGFHNLYMNTGSATQAVLAAAVRLKFSATGSPIQTDQRVRPAVHDWDNDGDYDLIMTDPLTGKAALYRNTGTCNETCFEPPVILMDPGSQPIFTERYNDMGRTKFSPINWDGDADKDLILTDHVLNFWPQYFENIGSVSSPQFVRRDDPEVKGNPLWIAASHETATCPVDWDGDGREDILIGGEDGHVYYFNRSMFDAQPVVARASVSNRDRDRAIGDATVYFNLDTGAYPGEVVRDDLDQTVPAPPAGGWEFTTTASFMHNGDMLAIFGAAGNEEVTFSPGLDGIHDIYVGLRNISAPTELKIKLSGETEWFQLSLPDSLGNDQPRQLYWKEADLTGRDIVLRPDAGTDVYLDYLKFNPIGTPYLPLINIAGAGGNPTLKSRHLDGKSYTVHYSDAVPAGLSGWQIAEENIPAAVPGLLEWTDQGDIGSGRLPPNDPAVGSRSYFVEEK